MEVPNLRYINQLSNGDDVFKRRLITVLKEELPIEKEKYLDHMVQKEFRKAAEMVHKIKHKISILGLEKAYRVAEKHEASLRSSETSHQDDFEDVLHGMDNFVKTL